ncbi:MAG TPA: phosphatase PAP2 family protein [candidate division Zixibacteria bacterium]
MMIKGKVADIGKTKGRGIILLLVFGLMFLPASGKAKSEPNGVESADGLIKYLYNDTKHVLTSPLRWRQEDILLFTTLSIGTGELMLLDKDLQKAAQRNRTIDTDRVSRWTSRYTRSITNLTISGLYLSGLVLKDHKLKETALLCMESVVLSEGITSGIKYAVGRARPFADKGAFHFEPLRSPPPSYSLSFPSGHATDAFALSSVIAEQYPSWMVRLISYSFAVLVSLGRVNNNVHFVSDIFWGGVVGTSVGKCLVQFHKKNNDVRQCELISIRKGDGIRWGIIIWL